MNVGRSEAAPSALQFVHTLRRRGHEVEFFVSADELLEAAQSWDAVAVNAFGTSELRGALEAARRVKRHASGTATLLGGQGTWGLGEKLVVAEGVDAVVEGEADRTLPVVLQHLRASEEGVQEESARRVAEGYFLRAVEVDGERMRLRVPLSGVKMKTPAGVVSTPEKGELVRRAAELNPGAGRASLARHVHAYPTEREINEDAGYPWDVVERYGWREVGVYAQRGCSWRRCSYCGITLPPHRRLRPRRVVELLEEAAEHGVEAVTFEDDHFIQERGWVREVCTRIRERGLHRRLRFGAMVRVETLSREMLELLRSSGFQKLQMGVESFLPEKLAYFRKCTPGKEERYARAARRAVLDCLRTGMEAGVFIITTRPKADRELEEVVHEMAEVLSLVVEGYRRYRRLPGLSFNDVLLAYPGASLLRHERFTKLRLELGEGGVLEVPLMYHPRSLHLANFMSILQALSRRRKIPEERLNESLEHVEDVLQALRIAAEHLASPVGVCIEFLEREEPGRVAERLGVPPGEAARLVASGAVTPEQVARAAVEAGLGERLREVREELERRRSRLLKDVAELERRLYALEGEVYMEVRVHMSRVRAELQRLERRGGASREEVEQLVARSQEMLHRCYPYYLARSALEKLVLWLREYARS